MGKELQHLSRASCEPLYFIDYKNQLRCTLWCMCDQTKGPAYIWTCPTLVLASCSCGVRSKTGVFENTNIHCVSKFDGQPRTFNLDLRKNISFSRERKGWDVEGVETWMQRHARLRFAVKLLGGVCKCSESTWESHRGLTSAETDQSQEGCLVMIAETREVWVSGAALEEMSGMCRLVYTATTWHWVYTHTIQAVSHCRGSKWYV